MDAVDRAAELRRKAVAIGAAGKPVRAARLLHRALGLLPDSAPATAAVAVHVRILASLAYFEAEQGRVQLGLELLDRADRLAAGLDDHGVHGNLHLQRGSVLVRRGSMVEALAHLDRAVALLDGATADQCVALLNRSALHLYSGDLGAADADLRQCIVVAARSGLAVLHAKAQFNHGYLAFLRGDLPAALRGIDAALSDPALLASSFRAIFMGGRAEALRAAGLTREADSDLAEAVEILRRERLTHDLAEALLARAHVALLDRRWDAALRLARSARRQFARRGNAAWGDLAELLALQAQLGQSTGRGGRGLRAVAAAAGSLAGRLQASGLGEDGRVASLVAARALLAAGDVAGAAAAVAGGGTTRSSSADVAGAAATRSSSADVRGAAAAAGAGAARLSSGDRIGTRLLARLVRAELAGARGDRTGRVRREAELRGGLADVHRYQSRFGSLDLQTASALHGRQLAELGLADAVRDGRPAVVFAWSERARALAARLPPVRPPDDPHAAELLAELRGVRTALRSAELSGAELSGANLSGAEPSGAVPAGQRVPELRRRRAVLERQVRQRAWFTAGPADVERPVGLAAVRAALGAGVLVAYLAVHGVLHALVVRRSSARLLPLGPLASATGTLQRVRADLDAAALALLPAPMRAVVVRSLDAGLRRLDAALWRPLHSMAGHGPVVIVPTSVLGAVPWTLLPGLRDRPLAVAPSATWWLAAGARAQARPADGPPVFAVGPAVPRGEAEVRAAAAAWCGPTGTTGVLEPTVLIGADATSGAVLAAAARARLLHVAAHGVHEPDNPLFSAIQLADGPLFGYDLPRAAALPAHVVLSACDLGLAEVRPGDEALGMTSALLHGGVSSVVAGVGRVGDEVASTVMVAYHTALAAGRRPAAALATALSGVAAETPAPLVCFGAGW